jgi:hypothetical protein
MDGRNYFCQLLTVYSLNDIWQTEIHTAEHLTPEPGSLDLNTSVETFKKCTSPRIGQIPA